MNEERAWTPVVAAREQSNNEITVPFPCRGEFNRYRGCIGARKCRGSGVKVCILGRWPDEREIGTLGRGLVEAPSAPLQAPGSGLEPDSTPVASAQPPRRQVAAERPPAADRPVVGIVHAENRVWQQISRQIISSGYTPHWLPELEAARAMVAATDRPAALMVDSRVVDEQGPGRWVLEEATRCQVPVLSLPTNLREPASLATAARMAVVWLTITLRGNAANRRLA